MRKRRLWNYSRCAVLVAVLIIGGSTRTAYAETSKSSNFQATEMQLGTGSSLDSCSTQYCAKASIGDIGGGSSKSNQGSASFGPVTNSDPLLEVIVETGQSNLGDLTTERTATKTMKVKIRNYLSEGYMLQIVGDPPKYGNHALNTPSSPTASRAGTEQFAINVAANTTPSVGAAPLQVPSGQISFGQADDDYKTPNLFKYTSGDVVARSLSASGQTDYTVSMIVNVSNTTPAGHYTGDFAAVVIPVY